MKITSPEHLNQSEYDTSLASHEKRELSLSQQAALHELDEGVELSKYNSLDIIGVFSGVKPNCTIGLDHEETFQKYQSIVDQLGLVSVSTTGPAGGDLLVISNNHESANQLAEQWEQIDSPEEDLSAETEYKIGGLLGYPETATKHYIDRLDGYQKTGKFSDFVVLPEHYEDARYFVEFVLSPEHYREEMANYVEPLCQATKQYAPRLYDRIVQEGPMFE